MGVPKRLEWHSASGGNVPEHAIHAGFDSGNKVYIARAYHNEGLIPGKLHKSNSYAHIPFGSKEITFENYEILVGPPACVSWIDGKGGDIPGNAIPGGHDTDGETLYIGRVVHKGTVTVGKVHPSHGTCYVSYDGNEIKYPVYEILVKNKLGQFLNA